MCWTRPASQEHLRVLRGQAPHPCLRANPQPSARSVLLPVAPQPLRKQPGVQRDLRARPAPQLRERAQPWPRGTLSRALSFVGTPGLWHSRQETLCGECFNKSPFENGIFLSQRARALLRQLGPPHHHQQPNPPPRWGSEKHLLPTERPGLSCFVVLAESIGSSSGTSGKKNLPASAGDK